MRLETSIVRALSDVLHMSNQIETAGLQDLVCLRLCSILLVAACYFLLLTSWIEICKTLPVECGRADAYQVKRIPQSRC